MTAALLVGAVLVAAAACPVMMWLQAPRPARVMLSTAAGRNEA